VYIDRGDTEENKTLFDWLYQRREAIEGQLGHALEWERLDDRRASRVATYRPGTIDDAPESLAEIRAWMVQELLVFRKTFGPLLGQHGKRQGRRPEAR